MNRSARFAGVTLITDGRGDARRLLEIVSRALRGGVRVVQLREPGLSARQLAALCDALRPEVERARALLLVNDRVDVAAAGHADGVHLAKHSLPPAAARRLLGPHAVVGCAVHDLREARLAASGPVDYATLSPVFATSCKPNATPLSPRRAAALAAAVPVPMIWLGGIDEHRVDEVRVYRPFGVAARSALCDADDPAAVAVALARACTVEAGA